MIGCFVVFIPRTAQGDNYWPELAHAFYLTYSQTLFVMGIALIILPSLLCQKMNSYVRFILDTKFFNFVAKISFWTYLIHLTVLLQYFLSRTASSYFEFWTIYPVFMSHTVSSMVLGFIFVLLIEIPFSKLQKKLMHRLMSKEKVKNSKAIKMESEELIPKK